MNWKCTDCNWTGTNDELRLKTYPNGGDDTLCPKCGGGVEEIDILECKNEWVKYNLWRLEATHYCNKCYKEKNEPKYQ